MHNHGWLAPEWAPIPCTDMCTDMCVNVYVDVCIDMCIHMCIHMCVDVCVDMCVDMYMDMCVGKNMAMDHWSLWVQQFRRLHFLQTNTPFFNSEVYTSYRPILLFKKNSKPTLLTDQYSLITCAHLLLLLLSISVIG